MRKENKPQNKQTTTKPSKGGGNFCRWWIVSDVDHEDDFMGVHLSPSCMY